MTSIGQLERSTPNRAVMLLANQFRREYLGTTGRNLVTKLKKGRASDNVVSQILRYMGYVQELAEAGQKVKSVIIALEDDNWIRRALSMTPDIDFYRYEVTFRLFKD